MEKTKGLCATKLIGRLIHGDGAEQADGADTRTDPNEHRDVDIFRKTLGCSYFCSGRQPQDWE